jgi:hypothetical protein
MGTVGPLAGRRATGRRRAPPLATSRGSAIAIAAIWNERSRCAESSPAARILGPGPRGVRRAGAERLARAPVAHHAGRAPTARRPAGRLTGAPGTIMGVASAALFPLPLRELRMKTPTQPCQPAPGHQRSLNDRERGGKTRAGSWPRSKRRSLKARRPPRMQGSTRRHLSGMTRRPRRASRGVP